MSRPVLRVLGKQELRSESGTTVPLAAKAIALLTYLRFAPKQRAHRVLLADLLWSEVDEDRSRASLRQAVLSIRQVLGDGFLVTERGDLALMGELDCDAIEFLTCAARGDDAAAFDLYAGDFYERFALPGARQFELWATVERARMRTAFIRSADALIQESLDAGGTSRAAIVARRLIETDELRERSWRLLLEARLSGGEIAAANADADSMEAALDANAVILEPATSAILRRIRSAEPAPTEPVALRGALVARGGAFAALLDAWDTAATNGPIVRTVIGDAGLGKTRLLDDVTVRLRNLGARIVRVASRYVDREMPYALASQLADVLIDLPGAAGVSPESAATLVALEPRLRSNFPNVGQDGTSTIDQPLRRARALSDLLAAVSEERAVALLIDDVHWADDVSLRTLIAALARVRNVRLLVVLAQRHATVSIPECIDIRLAALSVSDIQELIESIDPLPDAGWSRTFAAGLACATLGIPLLVLEALQLLVEESLLLRTADGWAAADEQQLTARISQLDVQRERISRIDAPRRVILERIAVAGGHLRESIATLDTETDADTSVQHLTMTGWLERRDGFLALRHDETTRVVITSADAGALSLARRLVARALESVTDRSDAEWRTVSRLMLGEQDYDGLVRLIAARRASSRSAGKIAEWRVTTAGLLGDLFTPGVERQVRQRLRLSERIGPVPRFAAALSVAALTTAAAAGGLYWRAVTPYELRFVVSPLAATSAGMTPEPVVEIVNRNGTRVLRSGRPVQLRVPAADSVVLVGQTTVLTDSGVSTFRGLRKSEIGNTSLLSVEASSPGLGSATALLMLSSEAAVHVLSIRSASEGVVKIAGSAVTAEPGAPVRLDVDLRYSAPWLAASVMMAGVPTWGDPESSWLELGPMVTPVRNGRRYVHLDFAAPTAPGSYRVFLVMAAESDAAHIASATNWAAGQPRWHDGNDLATWGDGEAAEAMRDGFARALWQFAGSSKFTQHHVAAGVLTLVVAGAVPYATAASAPSAARRRP